MSLDQKMWEELSMGGSSIFGGVSGGGGEWGGIWKKNP